MSSVAAMAIGISCGVLQHSAGLFPAASCRSAELPRKASSSSEGAGCSARALPGVTTDFNWVRQRVPGQRITPPRIRNPFHQHQTKIVPHGGRSLLYENAMSYVLMEPGEDEQFVSLEELQAKLTSWLVKWPANELPEDLQQFESMDEVVVHLVDSACELDLGGGLGSLQWFEVRLEA